MPNPSPIEALRARAQPIPLDDATRAQVAARMNALASMRMLGARIELGDGHVVRLGLAEVAEPGRDRRLAGDRPGRHQPFGRHRDDGALVRLAAG